MKLGLLAAMGGLLVAVSLVIGLIPAEGADGQDCGSVLGPGRHGSDLCKSAREGWLPYVLTPLIIGAALLVVSFGIWWHRLGKAANG
jgi:hypothetical protein